MAPFPTSPHRSPARPAHPPRSGARHTPRLRAHAVLAAIAVLLLSPHLRAQDSSPATVRGTVVNSLTHQPIARALVTLEPGSAATLTDHDGRFSFTASSTLQFGPGARGTLTARRPGFFGDDAGDTEVRRPVALTGAGVELTVPLTPQSAITGELLLPADDLPDTLQLQLLRQEVEDGRRRWTLYRNVETTSDGHFRFGNLPPGAYLVHSGASMDPAPAQGPPTLIRSGYVPAFYPGVRELAAAAVTTLAPGQVAELRLPVAREPFYPVALPVANASGARNLGFTVSSDSFLGLPGSYSADDNLVHLELPAGHYRLEGRSYGPTQLAGVREFDVNAAPTRAGAITLTPPLRIPVTVHDELAHPIAAPPTDERVMTAADKLTLTLEPEQESFSSRGSSAGLQSDRGASQADRGLLENVTPGRYWVVAHAFSGYVASLTSGGLDLLANPLTVGQDSAPSPIEVTLRDDYGTLSATLSSTLQQAQAAAGEPLYLQLIPRSGAAVERTEPFSADGIAQAANLPPGNYLIFASPVRRQIAYRNPQALAALGTAAQSITVEPGGSAHATLDAVAAAPDAPAAEAP